MCPEAAAIPSPSPPCSIGLIVLEFSREENRDKDFVDGPLDMDQTHQPKNGMRSVPCFQKPLDKEEISQETQTTFDTNQKLKEAQDSNDTQDMSDEGNRRTKFGEHGIEHGSEE